jgi:hypothetical protein
MGASSTPSTPDASRRDRLLSVLADLCARGGIAPLLAPPVKPGSAAFPEPWKPTRGGVEALLRRLLWHAGGLGGRTVAITDERMGAPPTEHKAQTRVELTEVREKELAFRVVFVGEDDIVGTLAHEIGVAYAALHRPDEADPYRTSEQPVIVIDQDRDLERGSIACVYLGLGVVAANAAFQQYSSRAAIDAYQPHVYEVHRAGYTKMSDLAFLLAVQAVLRGERAAPPGLGPPQRDEVTPWIAALADDVGELRARLGISATDRGVDARPKPTRFVDVDLREDVAPTRRDAFRWHTHRGGTGMIVGLAIGLGIAAPLAMNQVVFAIVAIAGVGIGRFAGVSIAAVRCSACATVIGKAAETCRKCGAIMRGDIKRLAERLEAEERLESSDNEAQR